MHFRVSFRRVKFFPLPFQLFIINDNDSRITHFNSQDELFHDVLLFLDAGNM